MFACYLDASKAFGRLNHWWLFNALFDKRFPLIIFRLLMVLHTIQSFNLQWGKSVSKAFNVTNGVRNGGVLSPHLLNIYMD